MTESPPELPPDLLPELSAVALEVARGAAEVLLDAYGRRRSQVETKSSPTDMVSEVDRAAEDHVSRVLARRRPHDAVLGEEGSSRDGSTGVRWVVDPLDGTTNYLFSIPAWSVSVAAEWHGRPVVGVVIDPNRGEEWHAVAGLGATLGGWPCQVAEGRSRLDTALVATGFSYQPERRQAAARVLGGLIDRVRDIRRFGSAALDLCWVAGGRFDAFYEWGLEPWDRAAGRLMVEEAGGVVEVGAGGLVIAGTPSLMG
ncbi:MAG TPA: inositol monophosphatase family protein, partial [Acidimicrobiales bacterium]|nr:inositol monophosphatase family protein [Acidimicrobiales bacterium]